MRRLVGGETTFTGQKSPRKASRGSPLGVNSAPAPGAVSRRGPRPAPDSRALGGGAEHAGELPRHGRAALTSEGPGPRGVSRAGPGPSPALLSSAAVLRAPCGPGGAGRDQRWALVEEWDLRLRRACRRPRGGGNGGCEPMETYPRIQRVRAKPLANPRAGAGPAGSLPGRQPRHRVRRSLRGGGLVGFRGKVTQVSAVGLNRSGGHPDRVVLPAGTGGKVPGEASPAREAVSDGALSILFPASPRPLFDIAPP